MQKGTRMTNRTRTTVLTRRLACMVVATLFSLLSASSAFANFARVGALTLNSGENSVGCAVIDPAGGFAYFGNFTAPGTIVKVRLSDFTRVGVLTLNAGEDTLSSAVIDPVGGFAYFGTQNTIPGIVVKVRLSDFTRVGALTLNSGERALRSAVIDPAGGFAYFGASTSPGIVVKVQLSDFTRVGGLTLNAGEILNSAVIDPVGGFAYFGTIITNPGIVVKVRLSDFTRVGALTLNFGESFLDSAVIDPAGGFGYFGVGSSPGQVVKVRLSDFTRVGVLPLNSGEDLAEAAVIDPAAGLAYFGCQTSPGIVVKIDISAATPTPPTIQFSSSTYSVGEGDGRVNISVTRAGDTSGAASVGFATIDDAGLTNCNVFNGIASPRCDYENTIGTATWAAGDATPKTFSVAIIDDSYAEGTETFRVSLNNASGATLSTPSIATVSIIDNDLVNGPNPIDSTNFFVRQQYLDFLGREPDPPGFAGWVNTINNCSGDTTQCDRIHVSQLFFQSAEFQDRGYFVYRFYPVAFGRKPDYGEFVPDLASVSGFLDANQLEAAKVSFIAGFMARPAFVSTYNSLNNTQYVDTLINTAQVMLASRQSMINGLNNATLTRAQVLRQIVESPEVSTKYNHQAYAVMEYFGYLRRQPDAFYLQWIQVLDSTNDPRVMVTGFVNSSEYRSRFGP